MFCRYKGWNLGHMAQDKEMCQFCINNTGIQLQNFNLLSRDESHSFLVTSRKAGTGAAGWPSQPCSESRGELPEPREIWVQNSPAVCSWMLQRGGEWDPRCASEEVLCFVLCSCLEEKPAVACCRYHPCCRGIWVIVRGNSLCFSSKHFPSV